MNYRIKQYIFLLISFVAYTYCVSQEVPTIDWDALQETKPWVETEQWEPIPEKVTPGLYNEGPSDAIVLFNGKDLSQWVKPKYTYGARMDEVEGIIKVKSKTQETFPPEWNIKDGAMIVKPGGGAIETKRSFGDVQLHIEWLAPVDQGKESQAYSNSGIFLMGLYEIQVLNSYENKTYVNGQAGSIYKQSPPLVNASRPPGEWQAYDIIFNAPKFENNQLVKPATIIVFHNGVLIQNNFEIKGPCVFIGESYYIPHKAKLPLLLQDHGDKVRFRNIWVREL